MRLFRMLSLTACLWGTGMPVLADDGRISHYQPLPAENLQQALTNLQSHGVELETIVAGEELDAEAMVKIHELTYTLEVALARLQTELGAAADELEEVHLGSETMDEARVRANAAAYLETLQAIIGDTDNQ